MPLHNALPQLVFRWGLKIHCVQGQKSNGSKQSQTSVRFLRMVETGLAKVLEFGLSFAGCSKF